MPREVSPQRIAIAIVIAIVALALAACEPTVTTPAEASQRVRDSYAWMADAELCPADIMRGDMRVNGLKDLSCADAGLPMCFRQCRKGDVDACFWLAHALEKANMEDPAAQALYQRACSLGEPSGCTNAAARLFQAQPAKPDVELCVARTFKRTCDFEDSWGCAMHGMLLHKGVGGIRDDAGALEALGKTCRGADDDSESCKGARDLIDLINQGE
jgi:hypothetical protein